MKGLKRFFALALALCVLLVAAVPAMAARAEEDYTYTVRIFAGGHGTIGGGAVAEFTMKYGERFAGFDRSSVAVDNSSRYYVMGIREAGRDNDTAVASPSFTVTRDVDYVVAYGIITDMVAYTVRYVDAAGNELAPSQTYYGNVGDSPVIAYTYIEGYQPQAYNLTGALMADESQNVYTFIYSLIPAEEEVIIAATAAEDEEEAEEAETVAIDEDGVPLAEPQEIVDIREDDTPLANSPLSKIFNLNGDFAQALYDLPLATKVTLSGAILALIAVAGLLLFKKKRRAV